MEPAKRKGMGGQSRKPLGLAGEIWRPTQSRPPPPNVTNHHHVPCSFTIVGKGAALGLEA